ncbi:MAG: hypothetical protein EXR77_19980, partial [Myxococcales bacterium]|nr:hypothetical protein [Myxococcales bacterium]
MHAPLVAKPPPISVGNPLKFKAGQTKFVVSYAPKTGTPRFPIEILLGPRFGMQIKEQGAFLPATYASLKILHNLEIASRHLDMAWPLRSNVAMKKPQQSLANESLAREFGDAQLED